MNISQILVRPVLTEKSTHGQTMNKYSFEIHDSATKVDVKNALMTLYGATVEKVNILHVLPKYRVGRKRNLMQKRSASRRAIVTLKAGSKLELSRTKASSKTTNKAVKAA